MTTFWSDTSGSDRQRAVLEPEAPSVERAHAEPVPELSPRERSRLRESCERYLRSLFSQHTKIAADDIDLSKPIEGYGIDSVLMTNLIHHLEQPFGALPKTLFFEFRTLGELAEYFVTEHPRTAIEVTGFRTAQLEKKGTLTAAISEPVKPTRVAAKPVGASDVPLTSSPTQGRFWQRSAPPVAQPSVSAAQDPIAIVGLAGRYPEADDLAQFWSNLRSGRDCIREVPKDRFDVDACYDPRKNTLGKTYSKWGGFLSEIRGFDHRFFGISKAEADFLDPQERVWLETVWHTLEDAGYTPDSLGTRQVGLFVGVMSNMYQKLDTYVNGQRVAPMATYASIANRVSYELDLQGPSIALDTMCSSSLTAVHMACESIRRAECELAIAGGVNLIVHPNKYVMLSVNNFLSTDGRCRSFGEGGDGYVPGEGVGAVLLKPLSRAKQDGDHIYGLVRSTAINHGGRTRGYTVPDPSSQAVLIRAALTRGNIDPADIAYVEAHGTGTGLGDPIEVRGLSKAFQGRNADAPCPMGSVKSNIGHLESAAGVAGMTKVLLQLQHRELVPSIHADSLNPNVDFAGAPVYLQRKRESWPARADGRPRLAAVSGFGAGGANAHVVIEEWMEGDRDVTEVGEHLFVLSAASRAQLLRYADRMMAALHAAAADNLNLTLRDVAFTSQVGRAPFAERLAIVAADLGELLDKLRAFLKEQSCDRTFIGTANPDSEVLKTLLSGEDGSELVALLLERANLDKLARLWVMGLNVDFKRLPRPVVARRVSLPTYPFERTPCWVPGVDDPVASTEVPPESVVHGQVGKTPAEESLPQVSPPLRGQMTAQHAEARISQQAVQLVLDAVAYVSPHGRDQLDLSARLFEDLGFDSIMVSQLSSRLMAARPGLSLDAGAFQPNLTLKGLAARVDEQSHASVLAPAKVPLILPVREALRSSENDAVGFAHLPALRARRAREALAVQVGLQTLSELSADNGPILRLDDTTVHNLTTYDYLGLCRDPEVRRATREATAHYGTSASASRPVGGELVSYAQLERDLADFLTADAAVLFVSAHATNVTTLENLLGSEDLVLVDESALERSLGEGALASGAQVLTFARNDMVALDTLLRSARANYRRVMIAVEAVSALDGSVLDLPALIALKERYQAILLVDEDDSLGVLGASGRGLCEHFGIDPRQVELRSGSLNKSLASSGGFVAGDRGLVDFVKHHATSLIFAVSISPMSVAAAHAALRQLIAEPERVSRLTERARALRAALNCQGIALSEATALPRVTLPLLDDGACYRAAAACQRQGFLVEYWACDQTPTRGSHLAIVVTADHDIEVIDTAAEVVAQAIASSGGLATRALNSAPHRLESRIARDLSMLPGRARAYEGGTPPASYYRGKLFPEYLQMRQRLDSVTQEQYLYFKPHDGRVSDTVMIAGTRHINYSSFNYLGLSGHPELIRKAQEAIDRHGTSASASRMFSGTLAIHRALERALAEHIGTEDAIVFDAGHNTNVSAVGHLFGPGDLILHDALSHNSLVHGALLSGAQRMSFPHNDFDRLDTSLTRLRAKYKRVGIIVEGIYSQDGDLADLPRLVAIKKRHQALLFVDEAHSIGVIGRTGRGIAEAFGVDPGEIDILMGTISKALATSGGYITGRRDMVDYLRESPTYKYNIHLSAPVAAAALEAIRVLQREPDRIERMHRQADLFRKLAREEGLDIGLSQGSGIVPIMTYGAELAYAMTYALRAKGIIVHPFTYPVVPLGHERLRFFITADHEESQIRTTVSELGRVAREHRHGQRTQRSMPTLAAQTGEQQPC